MSPAPSGQTMNGLSDRPDTLHAPDNSIGTIFGQDANAKSLQSVAAKTDISITIIDGHVVSGTDKVSQTSTDRCRTKRADILTPQI